MDPHRLVASWLDGRARVEKDGALVLGPRRSAGLSGKLRRAYTWIVEQALVCPYLDMELGESTTVGKGEARVELGRAAHASYVLLPLLCLVTSQRLLFVGAPGRGKTTMATIMAALAGIPLDEIRRIVQHGHPQLTTADLLGSPLPASLVKAEESREIRVEWRRWIGKRVKIIDEYNRIPTKTQSALLSLLAEGYAESFEQVALAGKSAWYLTANEDSGGGTFQVIEALKDRIDVVVRAPPFHARSLDALAERVATARPPETRIPADVVFSAEELDQAEAEIRAVPVPDSVLDLLGFFAGQLDFCRRASDVLEYRNKDTLHLAGKKVAHVCNEDCPLDKNVHICTQTENGVSARALQAILLFAKALAYFRGKSEVTATDVRLVLPFTLFEKLRPNPQSAFFQKAESRVLLLDRATWITRLFDQAAVQHAAYAPLRAVVRELQDEAEATALGATTAELKRRVGKVQRAMEELLKRADLSGPIYDDLVLLKSLHEAYQRRLAAAERLEGGARE
ncbi:MoxR family ATPase [Polyangium sp. 15x6]|uniref:AAA family ATPase n=1 Tax=Polyangium sp. 15x6 TaxID=3042687 RepID=UPI00249A1DE4|nr:MoxR family ATPase [Polyangium sp. 15x6]MDI3291113.1 MoxR family ATPase [Polyangium sp. 15x6]